MKQIDVENDPQQLILKLEEQLQKHPVKIFRITGSNNMTVGLYISLSKAGLLSSPRRNIIKMPCEVSAEERGHLFKLFHD